MTEAFLQYVWQHQLITSPLRTTDGRSVKVLRVGDPNHDAGPDFFNSRLIIDDMEWAGNVELHLSASDWYAHHHSSDPHYNNVILHVVYTHDRDITLANGVTPPTVELRHFMHEALVRNYDSLNAPLPDDGIPCARRLGEVPPIVIKSFLDRMTVERIEAKSVVVRRLLDESHGNWEQTCYWLFAHYFGGTVNALPFELLAKATDQRLLARWKDQPQRLEAILYGQAGMLDSYFDDDYPRMLQADYEALRQGAALTPIDNTIWRYHCLRPSGFPTIRISQFATLVSRSSNLFATLLDITDAKALLALFACTASPYWDNHYRFDHTTERSTPKRIGRSLAVSLIINAWVPLLFVYGALHGQQQYKDQALSLLQQLPAEDNAVVREWVATGIIPENAAQSQALLHLKHTFCSSRRCLECRIGYNILKQSSSST